MHKFTLPLELGSDPATNQPKLGFTVNGTFIHDPGLSECGRFEVDPLSTYNIPQSDIIARRVLSQAIETAAENALNAGTLAIQEALGGCTGDVAGVHFCDTEQRYALEKMFAEYLLTQLQAPASMALVDLNEMDASASLAETASDKPSGTIQWESLTSGVRARVRLGLFLQKDHLGRVCLVSVMERPDFAELDPRHNSEGPNLLCTEDYILDVLEAPVGSHKD
jgi:hypothetical protein